MILKLFKEQILVMNSSHLDELHNTHIEYEFELNTNHLTPHLYLNDKCFIGDNIDIDTGIIDKSEVTLVVKLMDNFNTVIHTYTTTVDYKQYHAFGIDVKFKDIFEYVKYLENKVRTLEQEGDIV